MVFWLEDDEGARFVWSSSLSSLSSLACVCNGEGGLGSIYVFYMRLYIRFSRCGDGFVFWFVLVVEKGVLWSQLQHLLLH